MAWTVFKEAVMLQVKNAAAELEICLDGLTIPGSMITKVIAEKTREAMAQIEGRQSQSMTKRGKSANGWPAERQIESKTFFVSFEATYPRRLGVFRELGGGFWQISQTRGEYRLNKSLVSVYTTHNHT